MTADNPASEALLSEIATLRLRLEEAEGTLEAIQSGAVDALVVGGRVYSLEGAEQPYHVLVDHMHEGAAFLNVDGVIVYANRYLAGLLDTPLLDLLDTPWLDWVAPADRIRLADALASASVSQPLREVSLITREGESRPVLLMLAALTLAGQPGYSVVVTDLRARLATEAKILRLNRLYAMASAVNACIARQPERAALFLEFCRIAKELGGYPLTWIGAPDPASGGVAILAAAGATHYLDGVEISCLDIPAGRGPTGCALREGRRQVVNDFQQAEATRPWHDRARVFGLRAAASVPFTEQGAISGVFTLYGAEIGCFGEEELGLLQQLGADLTFALEQAAQAERLREAERQVLIAAERERATAAMLEQARLLDETQHIARIGSWRYDFRDPIIWSAETYRLYGVDPATFTPTLETLSTLLHPDDRPVLRTWLAACADGDAPREVQLRRELPDGTVRYLVGQGQRLTDPEGNPIGMAGTVQDITERKHVEDALYGQRELLSKIIDSAPSSVFAMDRQHRFTLTNRAHLQIWPLTESQLLGHTEREVFPSETADRLWADNERIMRERQPLQLEEELLLRNGLRATVITTKFPLFDLNGEVMGLGGVATDITAIRRTEAAYRISQEQLQQAVEASAMGIFEWDVRANTLVWSPELQAIWGYGPGEFGGHYEEFSSRVHADDLPALEAKVADCRAARSRYSHEYRIVWPNGEVHWVAGRGLFSYGADGQPLAMHGTVIDITARKRAEQTEQELALMHATARYTRGLIETSLDPLVTISAEGLITDVNAATEMATGMSREALIGTEFASCFSDPECAREGYLKAFGVGAVRDYPLALRHRDGHLTAVLYNAAVYRDATGAVQGVFAAARDISAIEQAETALRASEARFRLLANVAPVLIWMTGPDQKCVWCNDQWLAFSGRSLAEELGDGWSEGIHPDDQEQCLTVFAEHFAARLPFEMEYRMRGHNGEYYWLLDRGAPLLGDAGELKGYIGSCTDISANKALTLELEHATQELTAQTQRLTTIMDTISDGLHILDDQGRLVECNASFARMLGYRPEEMSMLHYTDWDVQLAVTESSEYLQTLMTQPGRFETRHRRKDGVIIDVEVSTNPLSLAGTTYLLAAGRDITTRKRNQRVLERQNALINLADDAILVRQVDGLIEYWNQGAERTYGWDSRAAQGQTVSQLLEPRCLEGQSNPEDTLATVGRWDGELMHARRDGEKIQVASRQVLLHGAIPEEDRVLEINRDITAQKAAETRLQLAASVFAHAREGIVITDAMARIVDVNAAFTFITGYAREEVLGRNPSLLKSGRHDDAFYATLWQALNSKDQWYGEIWNRRKNGELFCEMVTMSVLRNPRGEIEHYLSLFTDITFMKEHQQQLEQIAHYDALTLLPNRLLLADRLDQAIAQADRHRSVLAVTYLDLDGFKCINDMHGHAAGDALLMTVAQRMQAVLREVDTLARIGGDEFIALLGDLRQPEDCLPLLERLLRAAAEPVVVGEVTLQVSASIGVTTYSGAVSVANPGQLLRQADQAMYEAKQLGRNRWHRFDASRDTELLAEQMRLEEFSRAIAQQEFVLYFQPKVNLKTGNVIGAEALLRWQHPVGGLLLPGAFLPEIEQYEFGIALGEWVIDTAFVQLAEWHRQGFTLPLSLNIAAPHLQHDGFVSRLGARFARHPELPPSLLELEVLESSALEDLNNATAIMSACRTLGVQFALDDFGTGYGSLTYLRRLPVDIIKIDRSFVHDMLTDPVDLAIVTGVIALARAFHHQVIAEGVESLAQCEYLLSLGCELAQGYAIARPMPAAELPEWVAAWRSPITP